MRSFAPSDYYVDPDISASELSPPVRVPSTAVAFGRFFLIRNSHLMEHEAVTPAQSWRAV
jgi:hypothetical protein